MESFNTYDNISNQLLSLESDLDSEYKKCLIVTESFGSKIVNFIKNFFNFFKKILINIWKSLVSVLKILFNKIRDLFSSLFKNKSTKNKSFEAKICVIESVQYSSTKFSSYSQLQDQYLKAFQKIINRIRLYETQNQKDLELSEKDILNSIRSRNINYIVTEDLEYNDQNFHYPNLDPELNRDIIDDQGRYKIYDTSTVFQGNSFLDMLTLEKINALDTRVLEKALEMQDSVVNIYNMLLTENTSCVEKIYNSADYQELEQSVIKNSLTKNVALNMFMRTVNSIKNNSSDFNYLKSDFGLKRILECPDNEYSRKAIKEWLSAKIAYNKAIIEKLWQIILYNNLAFAKAIKESLVDKSYISDNEKLESIRRVMGEIASNKFNLESQKLDFSEFGLGSFIYSLDFVKNPGQLYKYVSPLYSDILIQNISNYDVTVFGHGKSISRTLLQTIALSKSNDETSMLNAIYSDILELYIQNSSMDSVENIIFRYRNDPFDESTIKDEEKIYSQVFSSNKNLFTRMKLINKTSNNKNGLKFRSVFKDYDTFFMKRWVMNDIYSPFGKGPFNDIEALILQLLAEQNMNINIVSCNAEGFIPKPEITNFNGTRIRISTQNVVL